ncbi:MAG: nitrous oxide reductase accessory protein NosL [Paracoccaceae bacterium]
MRSVTLLLFVLLAACREDVAGEIPGPVAISEEATAFFCQMNVAEMPGPKAQAHLEGYPDPLFFAQVRDGVAYLKSPAKTAEMTAFYVSDMAKAPSWKDPGAENWILAADAYFVVGADVRGGMGAPELAPFGTAAAARAFADAHGGAVMTLDEIPADAVLGAFDHTGSEGS